VVASILAYDFVYVAPRWSFKPTDPQYYFTFAVMLAVGLLVGHLARRVRRQDELVARTALEAETERLRSTLLSSLSHDFRTPLTTILGSATSLLEQDAALDPGQRSALLHGVIAEAQRMHTLTSNLLDLTRMEEGAVSPRCEWCPGDELLDDARRVQGTRLAAHPLAARAAADAIIWCDPRLVGQALANLLDNAVRHTPPGTPVDVRIDTGPDWWTLTVADRGPGLPAGRERDVMKKFVRGPDAGTGLGLAICAAIARVHGGTMDAVNRGGACFVLRFPQPPLPLAIEEAG
jgi:two-component system sensor histidine kinase KdpD